MWVTVARLADLPVERAVAARVGTDQVAVVRLSDDRVYAVGNRDPFSGANVMARGIVGSTVVDGTERRTLASPMYKQAFCLETGDCLTEPSVNLGTWQVRLREDVVEIGQREESV
ncbi:nitrite reductase small subunit NirD [Calidifontibacter sp. DB0510]|uniref:Nitrite reductase small subunit NirD n=1 Tax=Metallococcus carri TaxID=1656884 RepID=A0A967B4H9_9MICO|nr:nitrite reductase small subunit NirD [Metallococcus carri]NHN57130.1 nitrite reductase small subunit NirD [Metallococcus carri]NOP39001.1 nitrite reductase small subunit NirD [Calidifontibacter sp. DB2511S]